MIQFINFCTRVAIVGFVLINTAFSQANPQGEYTISSGASSTIADDATIVRVNPGSLISAYTLTLPANPSDRQQLKILFGGTMSNGTMIITNLTLAANTGQSIVQASNPSLITSGDYLIYYFDNKTLKWYKTAGVTQYQLSQYLKLSDTANIKTQYYNASGKINQPEKTWVGIVTPTTASGFTVDISSAGFNTITSIQMQSANNTSSAVGVPLVSLKSYTTTQVVMNIIQSNNNTIASLLAPIIGLVFATNLTGITIHILVTGY